MIELDEKTMEILATQVPTRDQISGLTRDQISGLTGDQISGLTRDQISGLTRDQISWLTRDQISWLTGDQISWLTRAQISWLTGDQISWLTGDQISWLTGDQISGLTGDQISWLTGDQISWLTRAQAIPKVEKLYLRMFADLDTSQRKLDQATFGPTRPPANVCGTPMCIAGHTVHLAGEPGYALADRLGTAGAAALIHAVSRPDVSCPRYDNYPNEWAMAYIKARAEEERAAQ